MMIGNDGELENTADKPCRKVLTTIPVIEENAIVDKLRTVTGKVSITVTPNVETDERSIDLNQVTYREERFTKDEVVEERPPVRQEGNVTIIPVLQEEAIIVKRWRLIEEIHLIREETTERVTESIDLRKDLVSIVRE